MTSAADALNVARSYLGVREDPPHSNDTIIGEKFGWNGVAWCAEFQTVVQHESGNAAFDGSASCSQLVGRYQSGENGTWIGNDGDPQPGDEAFLGSGGGEHTFMIEANNGDGTVTCIDGNWADSVCRVVRKISNIFGWGRPNYDGAAAPDLPPPSATAGRPVLRLGSKGLAVAAQQQWLNAFRQANLAVDGDFGGQTSAAVVALQQANSLTADGVVGPGTYALEDRILAWCAAQTAPAPAASAPPFGGTVRLGSVGDVVKLNQARLRDLGAHDLVVDGIFGHHTEDVVKFFQGGHGLTVDGVIGPQTWVAEWTT